MVCGLIDKIRCFEGMEKSAGLCKYGVFHTFKNDVREPALQSSEDRELGKDREMIVTLADALTALYWKTKTFYDPWNLQAHYSINKSVH